MGFKWFFIFDVHFVDGSEPVNEGNYSNIHAEYIVTYAAVYTLLSPAMYWTFSLKPLPFPLTTYSPSLDA